MGRRELLCALLYTAVLGLVACGGGGDSPGAAGSAPAPPAATSSVPDGTPRAALPETYAAGFTVLNVTEPDAPHESLPVNVWYPTHAAATQLTIMPWTLNVARDAVPADGSFRLVVISHGSGGNEFNHRNLGEALARRGFVVAAPRHGGNNNVDNSGDLSTRMWFGRPRLVSATIDLLAADPLFGPRVNTAAVGVVGHSAGGYTALALAGAVPQLSLVAQHCISTPQDAFCSPPLQPPASTNMAAAVAAPVPLLHDTRVAAIVAMAPIAAMFSDATLSALTLPARVYGAERDTLAPPAYHAARVAALLPHSEYSLVPNANHYAFLPPFPPLLASLDAAQDPPGFDRAVFQAWLINDVAGFLDTALH